MYLPFASDGTGNCYVLHWSRGEAFFWDHEIGEMDLLADSLKEFLPKMVLDQTL